VPPEIEWLANISKPNAGLDDPAGKFGAFAAAVREAQFSEEVAGIAEIYRASQGGQLLTRTVIQKANGDVVTTETHAAGDWRARAWLLSRRHPERWAGRHLVDVQAQVMSGVPGGSFDSDEFLAHRRRVEAIKLLSPEDFGQLLRLRDKAEGPREGDRRRSRGGGQRGRQIQGPAAVERRVRVS